MKITSMAGIKVIRNSAVSLLGGDEAGACIRDDDDKWFLIYDDEATIGRRRVAIAHELGHIFLGHELSLGKYGHPTFNSYHAFTETQADSFASRLLAPVCVLHALGIHAADDIADICKVSLAEAKTVASRLKYLSNYHKGTIPRKPLEQKVYEQFKDFIEANKR